MIVKHPAPVLASANTGDVLMRLGKKSRQRGLTIEYTLVVVMVAFAAFQVLLAVGAKAGSI